MAQSLSGAMIGFLLGVLLSAGVLSVLCTVWYFIALLSLANLPLAKVIYDFGSAHAIVILTMVLLLCCGSLSVVGFRKGTGIYTSADF